MTRRHRRPLTSEERRLWAEVARQVTPLAGARGGGEGGRETAAEPAGPPAAPAPRPEIVPPEIRPKLRPEILPKAPPPPARPRLAPLAPLERKMTRALARGRSSPDAHLDLHGLTQPEAHARLIGFLRRARAAGHGLVLVVTGHGGAGGPTGQRGVLRRVVPHWLQAPELRPLVLGFEEAGSRQGGAGALYIRLRRDRAPG